MLPHAPDAWIDTDECDKKDSKPGIVGYEILFDRHSYVYEPPRALEPIDAGLNACLADIQRMIREMSA